MNKNTIIALVAVLVVLGSSLMLLRSEEDAPVQNEITSFEECQAAGYPIMESYPERCAIPDGKTFTRTIVPEPSVTDQNKPVGPKPVPEEPVICTMDAFQCPDGSWVGRTGPNCEFVCP